MARSTLGRIDVRGSLLTRTPLHVGGIADAPDTDLPLARDGGGDLYVPGTSLAGVLRAWCQDRFEAGLVDAMFGPASTDAASHLILDDGLLHLPTGARVEIRDGVGIDRRWGGAAEHIKYDRAVVPKGTRLDLRMTLELPYDFSLSQSLESLLGHILQVLGKGRIRLGASTTRGLGWVEMVDEASIRRRSLDSKQGLLEALRDGGRSCKVEDLLTADPELRPLAQPELDIRIAWQPEGALLVKAGRDGLMVDGLPLVSAVDDGLSLVLPGSSVKGALREQAERIVRSLLKIDIPKRESPRHQFLSEVQVPLVEQLFGAAGAADAGDSRLGRGALAVADCYAAPVLDHERWQAVANATATSASLEPAAVRARLDTAGLDSNRMAHAYHVAVDRWTGGAADGLLFSTLEPRDMDWEPLGFRIDLTRIADEDRMAAVALLMHILNDLAAGWIRFGHDKKSGGRIVLSEIDIAGDGLPEGLEVLEGFTMRLTPEDASRRAPVIESMPAELRSVLAEAWASWTEPTAGGAP